MNGEGGIAPNMVKQLEQKMKKEKMDMEKGMKGKNNIQRMGK